MFLDAAHTRLLGKLLFSPLHWKPEIDHSAFEFVAACGARVFVCLEMLLLGTQSARCVFFRICASIGVKKKHYSMHGRQRKSATFCVWCASKSCKMWRNCKGEISAPCNCNSLIDFLVKSSNSLSPLIGSRPMGLTRIQSATIIMSISVSVVLTSVPIVYISSHQ